ncbi:MAG: serine hydrolase [Proteobacteria bacterium]|nr:serine hydrolase [Pseudomonadota bacterium]
MVAAVLVVVLAHRPSHAGDGGCREPVGRDFASASVADVGMAAAPLVRLNEALDDGKYDVRSLLILRDCKLVFERYKDGVGRQHNHSVYSVTKSVSSTLVGVLLHQGTLKTVDAPIAQLMAKPRLFSSGDWAKGERITLSQVMHMSSGLAYKHDPAKHPIYALQQDRLAVALSPELVAKPGTRFNYSDGDVSITGAVIAAMADMSLYRFAQQVLFDPLQMTNHAWLSVDRAGRYPGGWGLRLRPMDMLKIGQLYLQKGEWNGVRILDAGYPDLAWAPGVSKAYGLHWWIGSAPEARGTPYALAVGFKAQRIYVFPTLHMTVALTASLPGPEERTVSGLVVGALVDAAAHVGARPATGSGAALLAQQAKGFRGDTRISQSDQDSPRR